MTTTSNNSNIITIFTQICKMPYYKNHPACSGAVHNIAKHEDAIADILLNNGYKKYSKTGLLNKDKSETPDFLEDMNSESFIEQPFGTHNSPDFIIKTPNKKLLFVECKSSKKNCPVYNSGLPQPNYIYIFCSEKTNNTTIYKGSDIITIEQRELIEKHIQNSRRLDNILNEKLNKLDTNKRGIGFYTRPMYNHYGGSQYNNYLNHENKEKAEKNVFDYLKKLELE